MYCFGISKMRQQFQFLLSKHSLFRCKHYKKCYWVTVPYSSETFSLTVTFALKQEHF